MTADLDQACDEPWRDRARKAHEDTRARIPTLRQLLEAAYGALGGPQAVAYDQDRVSGSSDGHALWTRPDPVSKGIVRATRHLQRAHIEVSKVERVPAHWCSRALETTMVMPRDTAMHGVELLSAALEWVRLDELAAPEANALVRLDDETRSAVAALRRVQGRRLTGGEVQALGRRRCSIHGCHVEHHAKGLCIEHYRKLGRSGGTCA